MKNRKKIINAIKDCTLDKLDIDVVFEMATLDDEELTQYLGLELYSLRYSYDNLLNQAQEDQNKMLEKIKELEIKLAIKEVC